MEADVLQVQVQLGLHSVPCFTTRLMIKPVNNSVWSGKGRDAWTSVPGWGLQYTRNLVGSHFTFHKTNWGTQTYFIITCLSQSPITKHRARKLGSHSGWTSLSSISMFTDRKEELIMNESIQETLTAKYLFWHAFRDRKQKYDSQHLSMVYNCIQHSGTSAQVEVRARGCSLWEAMFSTEKEEFK